MSDLARTYERMKNIESDYQAIIFYFEDLGEDFYPFIRSCFPERDIVRGTSFLKLLITVHGIFNIKFQKERSLLLPIIYLYGPEVIGHEIILSRHPVINAESGTLINGVVYEELGSKEPFEEESSDIGLDVKTIKIHDEESLHQIKKKYKNYVEPIEFVTKLFLEHNLRDRITLSYNAVFKRDVFKNNHNVLGLREANRDVVWRTLCNNFRKMEEGNRPKYLKFFKNSSIFLPDDSNKIPTKEVNIEKVHNQMDVKECLKAHGTKNDLVTYEAIYILNIMGYPTGTRAGPIFPHKMKKCEFLYRLMSPYYFNALRDYQFYLYRDNFTSLTMEDSIPKQYDRFGGIENAIQTIRNRNKNVIDQSVKNLQSQHLIEEKKSSFVIKKRPIYIDREKTKHYEINLPSLSEINSLISQIYIAEGYIKEKSVEWQLKTMKRHERY